MGLLKIPSSSFFFLKKRREKKKNWGGGGARVAGGENGKSGKFVPLGFFFSGTRIWGYKLGRCMESRRS